ncbi:MAG: hypothetical protein ABI167_09700 [Nitrosospira sp.]
METPDSQRHQIIKNLLSPLSKSVADDAISLWEQLAEKLIFSIGEDGFDALFARTLYLNQATFPWLAASPAPRYTDLRFAELKENLAAQAPEKAGEANSRLLITFTDILASLIGEQMTTHLLRWSWDVDPSNKAN